LIVEENYFVLSAESYAHMVEGGSTPAAASVTSNTTLNAVNRILQSIGQPHATALESPLTGVTDEGKAELELNRFVREMQMKGWSFNVVGDHELSLATTSIAVTGVSGPFEFDETITGGTSGATGTFKYIDGTTMFLSAVTGTFSASEALSGAVSAATATTSGSPVSVTSSKIAFNNVDWLWVSPWNIETAHRFAPRGGFLFDRQDKTFAFSSSKKVRYALSLTFEDLTEWIRNLVISEASIGLAEWLKWDTGDINRLISARNRYRSVAERQESMLRDTRATSTPEAQAFMGGRGSGHGIRETNPGAFVGFPYR
jgi:hypothetical protein